MRSPVVAPPDLLTDPNIEEISPGAALHRVHLARLAGGDFNPCLGAQTRFAPIVDRQGVCVPSLYAGQTLESAIFETVFHDVPMVLAAVDGEGRAVDEGGAVRAFLSVPLSSVMVRAHSVLEVRRPLRMAALRGPDLLRWGVRREEVVLAPAAHYAETALWARKIHHDFPAVDGLVWTSNQCDPASAYVFFGDRVSSGEPSGDLRLVATRRAAGSDDLLEDIRTAGARAGILLAM